MATPGKRQLAAVTLLATQRIIRKHDKHTSKASHTCRWQLRIESVRLARRAYSRCLHLCPTTAGAWGDVGASLYLESQLRRGHKSLAVIDAIDLRASAERAIKGESKEVHM